MCSETPAQSSPYIAGMRRAVVLPALAAAGVAALVMALGSVPAHADGSSRASATIEPPKEAPRYTIMGDSHIVLMINDLYPGAHANGSAGTRLNQEYLIYGLNGISLHQVVHGRGTVKAGVSVVGTTNVDKWRQVLRTGPDIIVVNLGTNDGGPKAADIDKFMRLAGKDRQVFWVKPFYSSCPACRGIHDYQLDTAAQRHANLHLVRVNDLGLTLGSDGLHAFGKTNSRALWNRINETIGAVHASGR